MVTHDWPTDQEEHVWGKWYPHSRTEIARHCVHPDCHAVEVKVAKA